MTRIEHYQFEGSKKYKLIIRVRDPFGGRKQKTVGGFPTASAAKRAENRIRSEIVNDLHKSKSLGPTWLEVLESWEYEAFATKSIGEKLSRVTLTDRSSDLRNYTSDWFERRAEGITKLDVRKKLEEIIKSGRSKSRCKSIRSSINAVFTWAIEVDKIKISVSPVIGIKIDQKEERKPQILTQDQVRFLLAQARDLNHPWYSVWCFAVLTGMRSGELFALEWTDVCFQSRLIEVNKSFNKRFNIIKSTKAGYWRQVYIGEDLLRLLGTLGGPANKGYVLPRLAEWRTGCAAKVLRTFCLGIGLPSIHFHTLRSCFATHLLQEGVSAAKVMALCGWKDLKTMQRYVRIAGIDIEGTTEVLRFLPHNG